MTGSNRPPLHEIYFQPAAARQLRKLPQPAQEQIAATLDVLAANPRPPGVKPLRGTHGLLRVRSGSYRVIYAVADRRLLVTVIAVGDRREVYRYLRR